MLVVSKVLLLNPNFLFLLILGGSGEDLINAVHDIHTTLFCRVYCGFGLAPAKLVVLNSCTMFLKPRYELFQILYEGIMVLFWHSVKKVLEKISSPFYFHGGINFVFHGRIPILGTINMAKGVKV